MSMQISDDELHAYVDGELDAEGRATVEAHLGAHPQDAARVRAWQRIGSALRDACDPVIDEPIPPALVAAARGEAAPQRWPRYAMAASFALLGLGSGWILRGQFVTPAQEMLAALPRRAAVAHAVYAPEVRHPVEIGIDQQEHLMAWLSKRLGQPLRVPSLQAAGYALMGGRLLPGQDGAVAQFMFENTTGERLTLYLSTSKALPAETAFRFRREEGINVFYWVDRNCAYALSGQIDRNALERIAALTYRQLDQ